jgi:putative ABC transport system permease protein
MSPLRFIWQSVVHHRLAHLGVFAGAVLGATVLLGALAAGDSVAASLRRIGEQRIGQATHVVAAGDRFFREALAAELAGATGAKAAPVLLARGTASHPVTRGVVNQVQVVGTTAAFWSLAPKPSPSPLTPGKSGVAINETLGVRLGLAVGDTLVVRLQKPGILSGNAPIAGAESSLETLRVTVVAVVGDDSFGRFNLEATQVPPPSVFVPIELLQAAYERPGRANLLLLASDQSEDALAGALRRTLRLADYGLAVKWLERAGCFEVGSDRIFLDPGLVEAMVRARPEAQPVVSFLVNELRAGERSTPYSIATATTSAAAPFLPSDLGAGEVVIHRWLADDLQAKPGDEIRATYFQVGEADTLIERQSTFRVRAIIPLEGLAADRAWMPDFPGISDAAHTSDWDPKLPLDLKRIRDHDERYWDDHRGTPKAYFSLAAGQAMWGTRWGNLTALRFPWARERADELDRVLLGALRPELNQLLLRPIRSSTQASATSAVDFGGLFLGLSFFLIAAALGLVALLFQLSLRQRTREDALLGAVGMESRQLLRWRLGEGALILVIAVVIAIPLASLYTRGILAYLETIWAGQGAGPTFVFAMQPQSIAIGGGVFLASSLGAIWLALRGQSRRALSIRLAANVEETTAPPAARRSSLLVAVIAALGAAGAMAASGRALPPQGAFYLAGFASLVAGLALCRAWLSRTPRPGRDAALHPSYLGALNLRARRARNLAVVGLIATAVFMVLSVASFRKHVGSDWLEHGSGTGGFALWVETTVPQNPARDRTLRGFELFGRATADIGLVVPFRVGAGDNVNCFNLNTTLQPRLLAVDAGVLAARGAFRIKGAPGWEALQVRPDAGAGEAIPAFVDENTLLWALKRKVGDVLSYTDENGRTFDVKLVGALPDSLFQGHVIIDEARFLEKFPSSPGYSLFLADAKTTGPGLAGVRDRLRTAASDTGARVELTRDVLAAFHQIENTYIAIFTVLGTLGVVLGSLGLVIVVTRSLQDRRGEFAVLTAIGLPSSVLARMMVAEFGSLVVWGLAIGAVASMLAILPALTALPAGPALLLVALLLSGVLVLNLVCGWLTFRWSLRGLRPALGSAAL